MRVLLIQPPYDLNEDDERQAMPPLGLAYIAAALEEAEYEVRIIDCVVEAFDRLEPLSDGRRRHGLCGAELAELVRAFDPTVVGVSCLFSAQSVAAHDVCRVVKEVDDRIVTVMGGAHPSAVPEEVLADRHVDVAALGEGERTMCRLVEAIEKGVDPPAEIEGIAYRQGDRVEVRRLTDYVTDLDSLPMPARHLLPMGRYFKYRSPHGAVVRRHPCTNMITSRGCPARCSFCSIHTVWGRKFRCHSAERVVAEIEHLVNEYGVREIQFEDDNLTLNKNRIRAICEAIIERGIDVTWTTPNGVAIWALDEDLIRLMRRAGCYHIAVAVESGSQRVLREIINKPLKLDRVHAIVQAARKAGMGLSAFFVIGFPGETRVEIEQTFAFAMDMGVDQVHFFTATPYPGTALFKQCVDEGLIPASIDYARLRIGQVLFDTPEWTAAELAEMTLAAQARFYRRTAWRRPVRFAATVARKFAREPRMTMRKAIHTLLPSMRRSSQPTGDVLEKVVGS